MSDILLDINNLQVLDIPRIIANEKTQLTTRYGYTFTSTNAKANTLFNELVNNNRLSELINTNIYKKSINGADIIFLTRNENNETIIRRLNISDKLGIVKVWGTLTQIVIEQKLVYNNITYTIKSFYDKKQVINEVYMGDDDELKSIDIDVFNVKVGKENKIIKQWKHNFNFLPIWITYNKEFNDENNEDADYVYNFSQSDKKLYDNINFIKYSDTFNISNLLEVINETFRMFVVNNEATRPWIVKQKQNQREVERKLYVNQVTGKVEQVINRNNWMELNSNVLATSRISGDVKVDLTQQTITSFIDNNKQLIELAFYLSGINVKITNSTQKTIRETKENTRKTIETIEMCRDLTSKQWKNILFCYFLANGIDLTKDTWDFSINKNIDLVRTNLIDETIKLIQVGAKTPVNLIQDLENINEVEANTIWNNNKKWFKKNNYKMLMSDSGNVSGTNGGVNSSNDTRSENEQNDDNE